MKSKKADFVCESSQKSSSKSISGRKYNLVPNQISIHDRIKTEHVPSKEQIEQELLRAFDTQISFGQKQALPKGLSARHKQKVRSISLNSATLRKPYISHCSLQADKLKKINQKSQNQLSKPASSYPTHRTHHSKTSLTSSVKSFHHNKRGSLTSQFLVKKQTQKLVQKLLTVKPSQQVSRQKQLESYHRHTQSKHIMMHRFDRPDEKKGVILVKNTNCCTQHSTVILKNLNDKKRNDLQAKKLNAIELKQIQLRKMLKEEKRKNRLEVLQKFAKPQNVSLPARKNHQRLKTLDARLLIKRINNPSQSSQRLTTHLPQIRSFSKAESYQGRGTFAVSTPSTNSQYESRAPGHIKQRTKSYF